VPIVELARQSRRSAIFNGANIVVANLVRPGDPWTGISTDTDVAAMAQEFLTTIE
jgi:hypothetical protein